MFRNCVLLFLTIALAGCGPSYKIEKSAIKTEIGKVYDTAFVPKGHGSDTAVGFTGDGQVTVTPIDVQIPARYAIVFQCEHGKFVIDGPKAEKLYNRLNRGDDVEITYREVFKVSAESKTMFDLDFDDAVKIER